MAIYADPPPPVVYDPTGLQYRTEMQLGRGGFAICWQAQQTDGDCMPCRTVALKVVRSKLESNKLAQKFVTELQLHSKLHHHPNIVEFYRAFTFESSIYVALEVCPNGSLAHCLKKRSYLSMPEIRRYIVQTCGAVKYLHTRNVVHRDLKTGNLFLDHAMNVKVGDFGLAAVLVGPQDVAMRRTTMCGTLNYIAPEVLEKSGKGHNEKVDIWAIGIIAYTLAVGKAPFHASKPAEIITKVAKGEYSWPDLTEHENMVPDDLCNLVSRILVDENSRPSLDTIVSDPFFKLGYFPESLGSEAITARPEWLYKPPSAATIKRGYSEGWYQQCKASGVGEYAPGMVFSAAEGSTSGGSIYRECEREAQAGRMPIVPMPDGAVYVPFVCKKGKRDTGGLENSEYRSLPVTSPHLVEISGNAERNATIPVEPPLSKQRGAEPRYLVQLLRVQEVPPTSSHAETSQAAQTDRRSAPSRSKRTLNKTSIPVSEPEAKMPYIRLRPRTNPRPVAEEGAAEQNSITIKHPPIRPFREPSTRSAPRTVSRKTVQTAVKNSESLRRGRSTGLDHPGTEAGLSEAVHTTRSTSRTATRAEAARLATLTSLAEPTLQGAEQQSKHVLQTSCPKERPASRPNTLTGSDASLTNCYTDPRTILARAEKLRDNVAAALSFRHSASSALDNWRLATDDLPFVSRWVDYSKKYGIGYMLADGSVGVVVNHDKNNSNKPLMHAVVEHGCKYLSATLNDLTLETVPFVFFAQADDGSLKKVIMSRSDRKQYGILWVKFGRYMCNRLNEQIPIRGRVQGDWPITIVRHYQRVSDVNIWGFSNGCFQFNFPDHTKIVLSADGKHISFTALPLIAIAHMATHPDDLPSEYIGARKVLSGTLYQLLYGTLPTCRLDSESSMNGEVDIPALTAANALPAKLRFVADMLSCWVSGGGLGSKPAQMAWPDWVSRSVDAQEEG